jgi:enoyl-CoA hydratase/carnithine racemase
MRRPESGPIARWSLIKEEADLGKGVVQDYSRARAPQSGGIRMDREYETIRVDDRGEGLLLLTLNRPEVANALNTQMGRDLLAFFDTINATPANHRCIVVTGAGERAFCAGGDLKERNGMTDEAWQDQHLLFERMIRAFIGCPVPVVGAVNGAAYAGGCELALCCDFVYAAETARFALTEVTLGIMPGAGGTQNLPRAVGERRSKEIILTGRPFTAAEAHDWGMVNRLCAPGRVVEEALETGRRIADNAPISVRQAKHAIHFGLQMDLASGMMLEIEAYNRMVPTEDRREGVLAFNEKRKPRFKGR